MVRQAREMVAAGELGEIRVVQAEYPQDWLATPLERSGNKQAAWRTDPSAAAPAAASATSARTPINSPASSPASRSRRWRPTSPTFVEAAGSTTTCT